VTIRTTYTATFERQRNGHWTVEIPDVPGCYAAGRTLDEARQAIRQALAAHIEGPVHVELIEEVSW
jgi:predicted RNase H-like HicB family nuclease